MRTTGNGPDPVYNRYEVMRRFEHDLGAFEELVELFASCCPGDLEALQSAIDQGDPDEVCRITRRFRDAAKSFSCEPLVDSIRRLEEAVERGIGQTDSKGLMTRITNDLDVLQSALDDALGND